MTTSFGGQFEDDPKGFVKGDRARIIAGEHAGKFGTIDEELLSGYYVVTPEGETRPAILETFELEPVVGPRLVAGLPVPPAVLDGPALASEVADTITRLSTRVSLTGPLAGDGPDNTLEVLITDLDEVIVNAIEAQVRARRRLAELRGAK